MSCYEFTLLQSAESGTAAKTATRAADGTITWRAYDYVKRWWVHPRAAATHTEMAERLKFYSGRPELMVVAGAPRSGLDLSKPQLRRANNTDPGTNTLVNVPRGWTALDLDDIVVAEPLGEADQLAAAAEHIRDTLLPPEFRGIEMVAAATSSTGFKGPSTARLRLFCLFDRDYPLERLYAWARAARIAGIQIDPVTMLPAQPIYVARPIFKGMIDPVPPELRAVVLPSIFSDRVVLDITRYDARAAAVVDKVRRAEIACGSDWRALLKQMVGGREGFFEPLKRGLGLAARSPATEQEIVSFVAELLAARADRGRQAAYGSNWVLQAIRNFRANDLRADAEIAALKDQLIRK